MHEMALAASLVDLVCEQARANAMTRVTRVWLALGDLAPVERDALVFGFEVARGDTVAAGAELCVEAIAGRARCESCGDEGPMVERGEPCARCGAFARRLTAGDEMRVSAIEGA